jgi:hypothetical protein
MEQLSSTLSFLKMPLVLLFGSQFFAAITLFLVIVPIYTSFNDTMPTLPYIFVIQGVVAAIIGRISGLAKWWIAVQVLLPFTAFYSANLQIPAFIWLLIFSLCALVFWNSARDGIPLYLSNSMTWAALLQILPKKKGLRIIDLGGGVGGTALYLGRNRADAQILSMESAPIPATISKFRCRWSGLKNVEMRSENFWNENLAAYQVVYAFLSPISMNRLYEKVKTEMGPGSLFISNSFDVQDIQADEVLELNDNRHTKLYIYKN